MSRKKLALLVAAAMMLASVLAFAGVASAASSSATATATSGATSSASASAAGAAQYQYTSALPGTGGFVSPATLVAIVPAILLVGGGLLSAGLLLRRS